MKNSERFVASETTSIFLKDPYGSWVSSVSAVSWSMTREMAPLYAIDDPRAAARGKRGIAGAIIVDSGYVVDYGQIPVLDLTVHTVDEAGAEVTYLLLGVEILNKGDLVSEIIAGVQMTFVARHVSEFYSGVAEE